MAEAIGIAAATLQFLTFAKTCLSVFHEFRLNTAETNRVLGFKLEAEAIKFQEWCSILGVQDMIAAINANPSGWRESREMGEFQDRLRRLLRFDNERAARMTIQALSDMENIFQKARSKLAPMYTPPATDEKEEGSESSSRTESSIKKRFYFRNWKKTAAVTSTPSQPTSPFRSSSALTLNFMSRASGIFNESKWIVMDKKAFTRLLDDIVIINDCLSTFLADDAKVKIQRRVRADILRSADLQDGDIGDLLHEEPEVETMAVLAIELKTEAMAENFENAPKPILSQGSTKLPSSEFLEVGDFGSGVLEFGPSRTLSTLSGRPVLIEWTHYAKNINLDHLYRRGNLVRLLSKADLYRKFQTLPPHGMVSDTKNSRIGLVFGAPGGADVSARKEKSLLELLQSRPLPIDQRFGLARDLSMALHSLQSVNWLHKSFRSDNLVYFEKAAQPEADIATNSKSNAVKPRAGEFDLPPEEEAPQLYLMGWHISRPDEPSELSQSISISTQGYKLTREMIRLYSHPEVQGDPGEAEPSKSPPRTRFKVEHDIYSFGLVLLEIGLWKSVNSLRQRCGSEDEFRAKMQGAYCDMLRSSMGSIYWRATKRCLTNKFDRRARSQFILDETEHVEKEIPLSLAFERQVVSELERCVA